VTDLRGRHALVTGAGRRVGRAIAVELGKAGVEVGVHYHQSREGALETCRLIRELGGNAVPLEADLSDLAQTRELADRAITELGGLDILVASAGNFERIPYDALDDASFARSLELNVASPFALVQQASAALRAARGSVVFITCSSATVPFRHHLPYVVSKGALRHLMKTLSLELAPEVRVNAVAPGLVLPAEDMSGEDLARMIGRIPLARRGTPEDVAEAVLFLCQAPFITGQELVIDGGRTVAGFG
jgi:pteridine reductase